MEVLDSLKSLSKNKYEIKRMDAKFRENLAHEKSFFSIPEKLSLLKISAISTLNLILKNILNGGYRKEDVEKFLRSNKRAKTILDFTIVDYSEDNLSKILLNCYKDSSNESFNVNIDLDSNDILKNISDVNDIDKEINLNKIKRLTRSLNNLSSSDTITSKIQTYGFILQHAINITRDLIEKTEHPSKYRTKYIQRLIRNTYGVMKSEYSNTSQDISKTYEKIINSLKQIDDVLIAITLVTSLYFINRAKLSKLSRKTLNEISSDIVCLNVPEAFDVSVDRIHFKVNLNCPAVTDDVVVPHVPISEKLNNLSCEVYSNPEIIVDASIKEDLSTIAIIKNYKKNIKLECVVTKDSFVNEKTKIANLGTDNVYSPLLGYVNEINEDSIVIRDIAEPGENYLMSQINLLNEKYQRLNDIKLFLKYYDVDSLYPVMLSTSIVDDASTYDAYSGIEKQWKTVKKEFEKIDKEFAKQIEKISGKDNVEKNAKNETLYQIKEELDKEEEIYFKYIKLLNEKAVNLAKKTKAKSNEYELFEYYTLDLGMMLNVIENPNKIELEFRNKINEFIKRRYVVDGYKKEKLEKKINDLIKDIKNIKTSESQFEYALNVYKTKKSLIELKNWLTGFANKNNKLDTNEKIVLVNQIMFLFELYLDVDNIVQKYNILKKETTPKDEAIKEGGYVTRFILDLQKDYIQIPKDIKNIEEIINDLSLFTTYSIIDYKGKSARLYSIVDIINCKSEETDPYLNPKSEYEYKDIQYWLKYCSYATLMSVTNPIFGWSTGWVTPPILFPVIYIPIKPIMTKFGFIVLGISICGIYVFPWVLMANLSTKYTTPFGDPTKLLKNEIEALKKEISLKLENFKKLSLTPLLKKLKIDIDSTDKEIKLLKDYIQENKEQKPKKYDTTKNNNLELSNISNGIKTNTNYVEQYKEWYSKDLELRESVISTRVKLWELETEAVILQDAYDNNKSIDRISDKASKEAKKLINEQLDKLSDMIDNVDKVLSVLPISLSPETANFGITIKNPKPVIKIESQLDENINDNALNKFTNKFRLKNSDMLLIDYENKISKSIINYKVYKKALSLSMPTILVKDAFPHYSLLNLTNTRWLSFLNKDFIKIGATTYGFPSQLPLPL